MNKPLIIALVLVLWGTLFVTLYAQELGLYSLNLPFSMVRHTWDYAITGFGCTETMDGLYSCHVSVYDPQLRCTAYLNYLYLNIRPDSSVPAGLSSAIIGRKIERVYVDDPWDTNTSFSYDMEGDLVVPIYVDCHGLPPGIGEIDFFKLSATFDIYTDEYSPPVQEPDPEPEPDVPEPEDGLPLMIASVAAILAVMIFIAWKVL